MRKTIMKDIVTCDLTGNRLKDYIHINIPVLVADKEDVKEYGDDAYEIDYLELDITPKEAVNIINLLKRKYPNIINKWIDNRKIDSLDE